MSQRKGPYAKLETALKECREAGKSWLPTNFREVEEWLGAPLPPSAYKHRSWWSNNCNNYTNSMKPWERAGYRAEDIDMKERTLTFRSKGLFAPRNPQSAPSGKFALERLRELQRTRDRTPSAPVGMSDGTRPYVAQQSTGHHPLRGALKGTLRIVGGTDLTKPADPEWADRS